MLIWGALVNALAFTGSSYLFYRLSKDSIDAEKTRHDAVIQQLQAAQIDWAHKHQQWSDFINKQLRLEQKVEPKFTELMMQWENIMTYLVMSSTTALRACAEWFLHLDWWTASQRVGIHSIVYDWDWRSFVLLRVIILLFVI